MNENKLNVDRLLDALSVILSQRYGMTVVVRQKDKDAEKKPAA